MDMDHHLSLAETPAVAARLRVLRQVIGLPQNEFCERAGIPANLWNNYERGRSRISVDSAIRLMVVYHVTLDYIYVDDASNLPYKLAAAIAAVRSARE